MRLSSLSVPLLALSTLPLPTQAGLFDRLRSPSSVTDGAAPPQPPSEPSIDAFGGSAGHATAVFQQGQQPIQAGAPSVARGQPAVKTVGTVKETAIPVQRKEEIPYEGREYRYRWFRVRPAELKTEGITLGLIGLFVLASLFGKNVNRAQALAWWKAHIHLLDEQFASFAAKQESLSLVRADPGTYLGFASGRRGTSGLSIKISTLPRHDIPGMMYYLGMKIYDLTYSGEYGTVSLDFDLPSSTSNGKTADEFVFGLIKKNYMQELRSSRFDLQAFTSVTEPTSQLNGNAEFVTMVEAGLLNDWFLKREKVGIRELFENRAEGKTALEWLQSLTISDVVQERPDEATLEKEGAIPKSRKMILTMVLPPASRVEETKPLVELALNLLDVLAGSHVTNDMANRAKRRRQEVHTLLLSESRKEAKEKSLAEQSALKKRIEQDKMDKMTPNEKRKYEMKMRDKEMKKMAMKQQKK